MVYGTEYRIKQLQAEIDRLRAEQEAPPVWIPGTMEVYYIADGGVVSEYSWCNDSVDKGCLEAGNVFRTEQEAESYARALKLIEAIRRERRKAQGDWCPSVREDRHTMCWDQRANYVDTDCTSGSLHPDVFGSWKSLASLRHVVRKYEPELRWYFTEYLPSVN